MRIGNMVEESIGKRISVRMRRSIGLEMMVEETAIHMLVCS